MRRRILAYALIGFSFAIADIGEAADIEAVHTNYGTCIIYITGAIVNGDSDKFRRVVLHTLRNSDCRLSEVAVYSPGGNLQEAMNIGEQVMVLGVATWGPVYLHHSKKLECRFADRRPGWVFDTKRSTGDERCICASACFFIWAAGTSRGGTGIEIHRPHFSPRDLATMSAEQAKVAFEHMNKKAREYLVEANVPLSVIERMFAISSGKSSFLRPDELELMKELPYREELLSAKCGNLPSTELQFNVVIRKDREMAGKLANRYRCRAKVLAEAFSSAKQKYLDRYGSDDAELGK